jgi:hypothetical protein
VDIIFNKLDNASEEFYKEYSIKPFDTKKNNIDLKLTNYTDILNQSLKDYGLIDEIYLKNLKKESSNYSRIRRLEDSNEEKLNYQRKVADVKLDETFKKLKISSNSIIVTLQNLNIFLDFDEKIEKYKYMIDYQNNYTEYILSQNQENNIHYEEMYERLKELKRHSMEYYKKANISYYELKEKILNKINQIDQSIEKCADITFEIIADEYIKIKNKVSTIKQGDINPGLYITIDDYKEEKDETNYVVKTDIENYLNEYEFMLDIVFEQGNIMYPKVIGKVINRIKPKKFLIDLYTKNSKKGKIGRKIYVNFNNISAITDINFDVGLNNAIINTNFYFQEYNIQTNIYQDKEVNEVKNTSFGTVPIPSSKKTKEYPNSTDNINSKNVTKVEIYNF